VQTSRLQYFLPAVWNKIDVTVTPNVATAPNGTQTASRITTTGNQAGFIRANVVTGTHTASIYAKYDGNTDWCNVTAGGGALPEAWFDVKNGSVGTVNNCVGNIENAGNGWYRISITGDFSSGILLGFTPSDGNGSATSGTGNSLLFWGAQLEVGSTATTYIPSVVTFVSRASTGTYVSDTTGLVETAAVDVARYQDDELLLENAATNLVPYSEDFTQWSVFGSLSLSVDGTLAPDNTATATKLLCTGTSKSVVYRQVGNGDQARSFYAKAGSTPYVFIDSPANSAGVWFDLSTGTVQGTGGSIVPLANGWYRCIIATNFFGGGNFSIGPSNAMGADTSTNGQYLYIWGAQVETGTYTTSYIPTTTSSATRAADVSTSAASVSSWYNQDEGSLFVEAAPYTDQTQRTFTNFRDTADINKRQLLGTNQLFFNLGDVNIPITPMAGNQKLAYGVDVDNVALYRDGVVEGGRSSFILNPANQLQIGRLDGNAARYLNGHMKHVAYYDTKLPNSTLEELTS